MQEQGMEQKKSASSRECRKDRESLELVGDGEKTLNSVFAAPAIVSARPSVRQMLVFPVQWRRSVPSWRIKIWRFYSRYYQASTSSSFTLYFKE